MADQRKRRPSEGKPRQRRAKPAEEPWETRTKPASSGRSRRKPRQKKNHNSTGVWLRLLTMLVIVAVFILGVAIFFKVRTVEVTGNSLYTAEDVIAASGIEPGDNLMTLSKTAVAAKLRTLLPYIEEIRIVKHLPDTVVVTVKETAASYAVQDAAGGQWLINSSCKVLAQTTASAADYPQIVGMTALAPTIGQPLESEETEALAAVKVVLAQLETTDYLAQIAQINVTKPYDITLLFGEKYEIRLGGTGDMEYKIQYLTSVLGQLEDYQTGIIDLTFQEQRVARFTPW